MNNKVLKVITSKGILPVLILTIFFGTALLKFDVLIKGKSSALQPGDPGPEFLPYILLLIVFVLSIELFVTEILRKKDLLKLGYDNNLKTQIDVGAQNKDAEDEELEESIVLLIAIMLLVFVFVYLLNKIGFVVGSIVFLILMQLLLKQRNLFKSYILFPITSFLVTYLFFVKALAVAFPRGIGIFEQISHLFY